MEATTIDSTIVLNEIGDPVCTVNADLEFSYFNQSFEKLLNQYPEKVFEQKIHHVFPGFNGSKIEHAIKDALDRKKVTRIEDGFFGNISEKIYSYNVYPIENGCAIIASELRNGVPMPINLDEKQIKVFIAKSVSEKFVLRTLNELNFGYPFTLFDDPHEFALASKKSGYINLLFTGKNTTEAQIINKFGIHNKLKFPHIVCIEKYDAQTAINIVRKGAFDCVSSHSPHCIKDAFDRAKSYANQYILDEKQKRKNQVLLRALEKAKDGIIITDAQQKDNPIIYVNQSVVDIGGHTREELIGQNPRIFQGGKANPVLLKRLSDSVKSGDTFKGELLNERKDGSLFWNDLTVSAVYNEFDTLTHFIGIQKDVTERKQLQNALSESNNLFSEVLDVAQIGFWKVDVKNMTVYWSDVVCDLHGVPRGTTMGVEPAILYYREDFREMVDKVVSDAIMWRSKFDFDAILVPDNKPEVWVRSIGYPVFENNEVKEIRGVFMDIQERKENELLAKKSREFSDLLFNSVEDLLCLYDEDGNWIKTSPSIQKIAGYSEEELIGKNPLEYIHPEDVFNYEMTALAPVLNEEVSHSQLEYRLRHKDGHYIWLFTRITLVEFGDSHDKLIMTSSTDMTLQKSHKAKLEEQHQASLKHQSRLLSTQINPHFFFNSLNAVQAYVLKEDTINAINFISNFSTLMRDVLSNSMEQFISLKDEVEWLSKYLALEQDRFSNRFTFSIKVDDKIDPNNLGIPPMLLQPFVENSIIHGVGPLTESGHITISFIPLENDIICEISDNGVGRKKALEHKRLRKGQQRNSYGVGITGKKIDLLNEMHGGGFGVQIIDKNDDEGNALGTLINLRIPKILMDY